MATDGVAVPRNSSQSPFKYGTKEWHEWQRQMAAAEIASRPTARLVRRPFRWEDYAPKPDAEKTE